MENFSEDTVIIYGDLLFRSYMLHNLLDWDAEILVAVDSSPISARTANTNDLAYCSEPDDRAMYQQKVSLKQVTPDGRKEGEQPDGRWIGMMRVTGKGGQQLLCALETLQQRQDFDTLGIPELLNQLVLDGHAPQVQYVNGHWMDINNLDDLERAGTFEQTRGE